MPRLARLLPALGAFFVLAIALAACGDSVPGNAVASVDGNPITRAEFDHWMAIAQATARSAQSAQTAQPTAPKTVYDPPDFTACVATLRATSPKPAPGQPKPNDAAFKTQCKKTYEDLRDQVLTFLINDRWIRGEARDQGVRVPQAQLDAQFDRIRKQQFPQDAAFQNFLKGRSMTLADAKLQVSFNTISAKLREKVTNGADKVTNQRIVDYYDKHKSRFAEPEKRDLRLILTKGATQAGQARAALEHGQSWKAVAKRFSIDPATKASGGSIQGLPKGQQEQALDSAIFGAAQGKLVGPVKTQFGYYVLQVQKIVPARQQSLKQATPMIKQQLQSQFQSQAITRFAEGLRKKWKAKTNCRQGFVTQDCKNAPKLTTTATQSGGAQPQPQQPSQPQQAPPPSQP